MSTSAKLITLLDSDGNPCAPRTCMSAVTLDSGESAESYMTSAISVALNRSDNVSDGNTNYSTLMARGIGLVSTDTTPTVNGAINFTYG